MMIAIAMTAWRKAKALAPMRGSLRVAAYVGVVAGVAGLFGVHKAHAGISEGTLHMGRDMLPLAEFLKQPTPMTLNGENIVLAVGSSDKSAHEILNTYESFCRTSDDSLGKEWSNLANQTLGGIPKVETRFGGSFDLGVYRKESAGEGALLCFMRGSESSKSLTDSIMKFQESHDLGALGKVRYVYIRPNEDGHSTVFTAWTDDHFRMDAFAPNGSEDAPGSDPAGIPRPPQSQRLLSAQIATSPFGTHVYRSAASEDQVRDFYDAEMSKAGWMPLGWGDQQLDPGKHRIYVKEGIQIALANTKDERGTLVSLGELGARPNESEPYGAR
ncbi:hypothetical protein [Pendulispora albinea]|uniref:Uncharacterized protein n=1 Tax=Pendulispora albinea TaxID=2741071 RepID=A0ABZ2MBU8_9BACT